MSRGITEVMAKVKNSEQSGTTFMRVRKDLLENIDNARGDMTRADYLDSLLSGMELPSVYGQLSDIGEKVAILAEGIARLTYKVDIIKESLRKLDPELHTAMGLLDEALDDEITGEEFLAGMARLPLNEERPSISDEKRQLLMDLLQAEADRDMLDWTDSEREEVAILIGRLRKLKKPSE